MDTRICHDAGRRLGRGPRLHRPGAQSDQHRQALESFEQVAEFAAWPRWPPECWEIGVTGARCHVCPPWMVNQHTVPHASCQCGLHAFSTPSEAVRHAELRVAPADDGCEHAQPVAGAVVGWGRVIQHGRQGWRAESARPVALLETGRPLLEEAAARYGLPLVSMRGLCLLPLEYGAVLKVGVSH